MNRFRQLKQKLINSKRDSQKLQQLQKDQTQLEAWVQKQLQYYGINRESYKLRQLKNIFCLQPINNIKANPQSQNSVQNNQKNKQQQNSFNKKKNNAIHTIVELKQDKNHCSPYLNRKQISECQKLQHAISMDEIRLIKKKQKSIRTGTGQSDRFQSQQNECLQTQDSNKKYKAQKQLDYYTLILQLTAQLNYSRLNKQSSNQKSILKQIKNLIEFIEGKSGTQTGVPHSKNSNKKSNHTFSSIYSNQTLKNQNMEQNNEASSSMKRIKYKICTQEKDEQNYNSEQNDDNESWQDKTFQSINGFQDQKYQEEQAAKSIIDMVNDQNDGKDDILIQESNDQREYASYSNDQQSFMENSPLSRITEHQSEYTQSANPSLNVSPTRSKLTPCKPTKYNFKIKEMEEQSVLEKHLQSLYSQNRISSKRQKNNQLQTTNYNTYLNKQSSDPQNAFLKENDIILKTLTDKLQKTQQFQSSLQQTLQFKRIMYMLDSQYSDSKNRCNSSGLMAKSSTQSEKNYPNNKKYLNWANQQIQSNIVTENKKLQFLSYPVSDSSIKSFAKQIFQSNQEHIAHQQCNKNRKNSCLMNQLDKLFGTQNSKYQNGQILMSKQNLISKQSLNCRQTFDKFVLLSNQNVKKNKLNHNRSRTSCFDYSRQKFNNNAQHQLSILSQITQSINQNDEIPTKFNIQNKYIESEQDSTYQKISRNSYLTSASNHQKNIMNFSQNQQFQPAKYQNKRTNLIVKKKKIDKLNTSQNNEPKILKFIVKKPAKKQNNQNLNQNCIPISKQIDERSLLSISTQKQITKYQKEQSRISKNSGQSIKSKRNMQDSKISSNSSKSKSSIDSNRQIKYRICQQGNIGITEKQDKQKVLKDIVSMLNTKYNKNIKLKSGGG